MNSGGLSFIGALQLLFIALKLMHKIEWSWLVVFSPLIFAFTATIAIFTASVVYHVQKRNNKNTNKAQQQQIKRRR